MADEGAKLKRRMREKLKRLTAVRRSIASEAVEEHCGQLMEHCLQISSRLAIEHGICGSYSGCCCLALHRQLRKLRSLTERTKSSLAGWQAMQHATLYEAEIVAFMNEACIRLDTISDLTRCVDTFKVSLTAAQSESSLMNSNSHADQYPDVNSAAPRRRSRSRSALRPGRSAACSLPIQHT